MRKLFKLLDRDSRTEPNSLRRMLAYVWSTLAIVAAIGFGQGLSAIVPLPHVSMIFLVAVLFVALVCGMWPAIYASLLSFLAYNFFFIAPLYTFTVAEPYELLALFVFLLIAVITSALAGRVREQAHGAEQRVRSTRQLYEFTRKVSALARPEDVAEGAASEISSILARPAMLLLEQAGELSVTAAWPPEDRLEEPAMSAARLAFAHDQPAGADTATLPDVPWLFIPLRSPRGRLGVIGIARTKTFGRLDTEARTLLEAIADQAAAALDRAALAREILAARTAAATERVRNTMLASISHDFRTPLASILGSATSLIEYGDKLEAAARKDLLLNVLTEAEGLDDMVRNLLAIARIEERALELRLDWIDLREVVDRVISAARRRGARQMFETALSSDLPLLRADAMLVEQSIGNVVNNAVVHTPAGTRVTIDAICEASQLAVRITDDGPGIPTDILPRIFDKFVRHPRSSTGSNGGQSTGLGLAIARGILEAHGGTIGAESPVADGHGARFLLRFPRTKPP